MSLHLYFVFVSVCLCLSRLLRHLNKVIYLFYFLFAFVCLSFVSMPICS